jgi:hypothetical protein
LLFSAERRAPNPQGRDWPKILMDREKVASSSDAPFDPRPPRLDDGFRIGMRPAQVKPVTFVSAWPAGAEVDRFCRSRPTAGPGRPSCVGVQRPEFRKTIQSGLARLGCQEIRETCWSSGDCHRRLPILPAPRQKIGDWNFQDFSDCLQPAGAACCEPDPETRTRPSVPSQVPLGTDRRQG